MRVLFVDVFEEEKYSKEKNEIVDEIKLNEIDIQDITIKKQNRFIVEIYLMYLLTTHILFWLMKYLLFR